MNNNFKILLLEDEEDINILWTKSLKNEGYKIISFLNGQKFIDYLNLNKKEIFDLAILDIMVPGINGLDITKYIHDNFPNIYIIILSSKEDPEIIDLGFNLGAHEYLKKPCSSAELKIRIKQIIKNKNLSNDSLLGKIKINNLDCSVEINNKKFFLSNTEYKIFYLLLKQNHTPIKKNEIIKQIWNVNVDEDSRILELNIYNIRKKINKNIIKSSNDGYYIEKDII